MKKFEVTWRLIGLFGIIIFLFGIVVGTVATSLLDEHEPIENLPRHESYRFRIVENETNITLFTSEYHNLSWLCSTGFCIWASSYPNLNVSQREKVLKEKNANATAWLNDYARSIVQEQDGCISGTKTKYHIVWDRTELSFN